MIFEQNQQVKCSGEVTGCQRCQGTGTTCVFPERTKRGTKRQKNSAPTVGQDGRKSIAGSEMVCSNGESSRSRGTSSSISSASTRDSHPFAPVATTSEFSPTLDFSPSEFSLHCAGLAENFTLGMSQLRLLVSTKGTSTNCTSTGWLIPRWAMRCRDRSRTAQLYARRPQQPGFKQQHLALTDQSVLCSATKNPDKHGRPVFERQPLDK
jgi:hypothetical protein